MNNKVKRSMILLLSCMLLFVGNTAHAEYSARKCRELTEYEDVMMSPNTAFPDGDMRTHLKMTPEESCKNKDAQLYNVRAAKNFTIKTRKVYDDNRLVVINVKKRDVVMIFDNVDLRKSNETQIVVGLALLKAKTSLFEQDAKGEMIKSKPIDGIKSDITDISLKDEKGDVDLNITEAAIYEKPSTKNKVVGRARKHLLYATQNVETQDEGDDYEFAKIELPGGSVGYIHGSNIAITIIS